jgi:acetyl-CoA carboxylase biotin carboxyl carrier protein
MDLSQDEVMMILKIVQESDISFLDLRMGELRLVLGKEAPGGVPAGTEAPRGGAAGGPAGSPRPPAEATGDEGSGERPGGAAGGPGAGMAATGGSVPAQAAAGQRHAAVSRDEGVVAVKAPMVGVFYSRPEPGAAPFVQVGDPVDEETTVGLIEVMKVFNAVKARVAGRVERILAEDGQFVEFGQDLLLIGV